MANLWWPRIKGVGMAGGGIAGTTAATLDAYKDEPWVGRLRDVMHPPRYTEYPEDPRIGGYRMGQTVEPAPDEAAMAQDAREAAATRGRGEISPAAAIERRFGEFAPLSPPGRAEAFKMGGIADVNEAPDNYWRQYDKATAPSLVKMMNEPGDVGKLGPELQQKLFTDDMRARQRAADPAAYRQGAAPRPGPLAPTGTLDKPILGALNPALDLYLPSDASPLNAGLAVATGPVGGKLVRGGAAALGALFEPDEAEAGKVPKLPKGAIGKIGKTVENWTPPFPQYAERYPEVGPGTPTIDPKTKREYLAKELTPEAVAFQKARAKIMLDMEKNGYEPFFDVSKREHVDPANYPPNVDTRTIIPKKQATIDKHMENIDTEDARQRLRAAYERGTQLPNTENWYALKQLEDEFIKELGPEAGRKAFQDRIATSMAATTGGADPTSNWLMAHYGNYLRTTGQPYPEAAHEMPFPIGGRYASGNMAMHQKIFDEGGFAALGEGNPKRHNFSQNFTGNRGAATMDEQMTSGMTPGVNMPPVGTYGLYEKVLGEEAAKVGVQPQNYQDVGWAGFKNLKDPKYTSGEPFIQTINESIERTHRLTGMPKDEILRRGIIKGEIPMYAVMGAVGLGAVADQKGYAP